MKHFSEWYKQLNPTIKVLNSFVVLILVGTILLSLPISNQHYSIGLLNNLFIATSATCVTGLSPVAVADTYTRFGQIVLLVLIQIGGLGFITLYVFFSNAFRKKMSMRNKGLIEEALSLEDNFGVKKALRIILGYTFIFELLGAALLTIRFVPEFGMKDGIFTSIFISISAFCNAGFDNLGGNSLMNYATDPLVNLVVSGLVIIGGIGFTVWFEIGRKLRAVITRKMSKKKALLHTKLHTKLAIETTIFLLVSGTIFALAFEWSNPGTFGGMNAAQKILAGFFTSMTLRTAGFATVDFAALRPGLQFIMLLYMITGGSPGGTAGGLKTTTLAVFILGTIYYVRGEKNIRLHSRQLSEEIWHRAIALLGMAVLVLFIGTTILLISETQLTFMEIVFEAVSAFATVGLSLSVTARLSAVGKMVIIILMYTGRVGVLSVGAVFASKGNTKVANEIQYPEENILIG